MQVVAERLKYGHVASKRPILSQKLKPCWATLSLHCTMWPMWRCSGNVGHMLDVHSMSDHVRPMFGSLANVLRPFQKGSKITEFLERKCHQRKLKLTLLAIASDPQVHTHNTRLGTFGGGFSSKFGCIILLPFWS